MADAGQIALLVQRGAYFDFASDELDLIAPLARSTHGSGDWSQRRVIATHGIQRNSDHQASGIIPEQVMGVLDEVRANAEAVSKSARSVRVRTDAIGAYAVSLPLGEL